LSFTGKIGDRGPLSDRKARFAELLANAPSGIQYSEHLEDDGAAIFAHACKLGAEGVVSKHREHPYRSGPSKDQEPGGAWDAAVPGGAMTEGPDQIARGRTRRGCGAALRRIRFSAVFRAGTGLAY
jgi:hypothetical protein